MADPEKSFIEKINIIAANIDQLTAYQIAVSNGFIGTEAEWLLSIKGADGANGADGAAGMNGADGLSTYQIAVNNGFAGTEADWLLSIKGTDGANGADGTAGMNGADGLSTYQIAINNGFVGTEAEWLLSIKGEKGADGTMTFADLTPEQILSLKGDIGEAGASGANGESAYQVAVNNGYIGTEIEWVQLMQSSLPKSGGAMTGAITCLIETKIDIGAENNIDLSLGNLFTKTITAATTFTISNISSAGNVNSFILELTNGGLYPISWFSGVKWDGGIAPTLTPNGVDILGFFSHDAGITKRGILLSKDSK